MLVIEYFYEDQFALGVVASLLLVFGSIELAKKESE